MTRIRRSDGLTQLRPLEQRVSRGEWYLGAFTVLLLAGALFVSTAIPPSVLGLFFLACLSGEVCFGIRALLELRNPPAQVLALAPSQRPR